VVLTLRQVIFSFRFCSPIGIYRGLITMKKPLNQSFTSARVKTPVSPLHSPKASKPFEAPAPTEPVAPVETPAPSEEPVPSEIASEERAPLPESEAPSEPVTMAPPVRPAGPTETSPAKTPNNLAEALLVSFEAEGLSLSVEEARRILASFACNRLVAVVGLPQEKQEPFIKAIAAYFGASSLVYHYVDDGAGFANDTFDDTLLSFLTPAAEMSDTMALWSFLDSTPQEFNDFFHPMKKAALCPDLDYLLHVDQTEAYLHPNVYFLVFFDQLPLAPDFDPELLSRLSCLSDLTIGTLTPGTPREITGLPLSLFAQEKAKAKAAYFWNEETWKKVDAIETFVAKKTPFSFDNLLCNHLEDYAGLYLSLGGEVELRPDGGRCRGLSRNQWCVAVALGPGKKAMAMVEGKGKSSSAKVLDAFRNHIKPGSALIHDLDFSHKKLIAELSLADEGEKAIYKFNCQSGLDPMNAYCSNMEDFVRLHRGMNKHRLQDWTNLFAFKFGCPGNALQKAEKLLDLLLKCKEIVRYRD
jgi:hypothetical protein